MNAVHLLLGLDFLLLLLSAQTSLLGLESVPLSSLLLLLTLKLLLVVRMQFGEAGPLLFHPFLGQLFPCLLIGPLLLGPLLLGRRFRRELGLAGLGLLRRNSNLTLERVVVVGVEATERVASVVWQRHTSCMAACCC
jgi:hypothetical protein